MSSQNRTIGKLKQIIPRSIRSFVKDLVVKRKQFQYLDANGNLDYELYKKIQVQGNKEKLNAVWESEENIRFLSEFLKRNVEDLKFGICHGTRMGKEQEWFRKYLSTEVIGTEISDTATQFPHTIQWDFHRIKPEWVNSVDFIYSNSLDHSYDPEFCLEQWMKCVREGGVCIINHTDSHRPGATSILDPFGITKRELAKLIRKLGGSKYQLYQILEGTPPSEAILRNIRAWDYFVLRRAVRS